MSADRYIRSGDDDFPVGVAALSRALAQERLSAQEATQYYLQRIADINPHLNAYITITDELALQQAQASDRRRAAGNTLGPLDGIPVALKDNIDVAGIVTTAGIAARRQQIAAADAGVIERLRAAGAVFLGKTNMHEAALGATTDNPFYGRCHNPHRHGYTPGGSSGGSGTAVAAALCAAALGTDTLGSVRVPASYCGCYGFKASTGLISNSGVVPLSWTLDHVGPLALRAADLALLVEPLTGYDAACAGSHPVMPAEPDHQRNEILRIGYIDRLEQQVELQPAVQQAFEKALQQLIAAGFNLTGVTLAEYDFTRMRRAGLLISEAEGAVIHSAAMAVDPAGYSEELRRMLEWGARQNAGRLAQAYYDVGQTVVKARHLFTEIDLLVLPTTPQAAFPFDQPVPSNQADLTSFANLARCPALSLPIGYDSDGLPLGLQLVGAERADSLLLAAAERLSAVIGQV